MSDHMRNHFLRSLTLLLAAGTLLLATSACDSNESDDTEASIKGQFEATTFTGPDEETNDPDDTIDVLDLGGSLTLDFEEDGTVSGSAFIPASVTEPDEGASDLQAEGTYTLDGDELSIDFEGAGDNALGELVTNTSWTYDEDDGTIRSNSTVDLVTVVLERQ